MNSKHKVGAVTASLALGLLIVPATDARTIVGDVSETNKTNVAEVCAENSLSIHVKNEDGQVGVIHRPDDAPQVLAGYTIMLFRVPGYELNNAEDWQKVQDDPTLEEAKKTGVKVDEQVTDDAGIANFSGLKPGLYYVEVTPPNADAPKYEPMLLTLPVGQKDFWNCTPQVFLKAITPPEPEIPPVTPTTTPPSPGTTTPGTTNPGTETETPDVPSSPGGGGSSSGGSSSSSSSRGGSLARTGASVIGIALIGAGAISLGVLLTRRRKQES